MSRAREAGLWGGAGIVMAAAHIGLAMLIMARAETLIPPASPPDAIMLDLAPEPVAPEAEPSEAPPAPEMVEQPEPVDEPVEEPEDVPEPVDIPEPVETPPEEPVEQPPEEVVEEREPAPEEPAEIVEEQAPEPETVPAEQPEVAMRMPMRRPPPPERPRVREERRERPEPRRQARPRRTAPATSAPSAARAERAPRAAAPQASRAERRPSVSPARWQSQLLAHLERHKRYPGAARSRREQGTVQLTFTINANGTVVAHRISRSSGNPALDAAVEDMIRRASPVPAPPPGIARARMNFTVPVRFTLR